MFTASTLEHQKIQYLTGVEEVEVELVFPDVPRDPIISTVPISIEIVNGPTEPPKIPEESGQEYSQIDDYFNDEWYFKSRKLRETAEAINGAPVKIVEPMEYTEENAPLQTPNSY